MKDLFDLCNVWLNDHSGLVALGAFIAAIWMPIHIYRKQKRDKRQEMLDEMTARKEMHRACMTHEEKESYIRERLLEQELNRK